MNRTIGVIALVLLVGFSGFSAWVSLEHGYTGFLDLAGRDHWGLQMLLDVVLACLVYSVWLVPDAGRLGIRAWPYLLVTLFLGSIGGLAYLARRNLLATTRTPV